jgi:DNA modification methylase
MNRVLFGDCRDSMRKLAADGVRVQACVTSPPYFGLRDYGHPGQIGLEKTPDEYVAALVEVFALVRELLADDGVLWLNLGDSYAGSTMTGGNNGINASGGVDGFKQKRQFKRKNDTPGLKPKDLIGIPWLVAFALQADGWCLRQDIIWHKPNPMPESVRDRCTKAHEYLFLLSKNARYYWDADAMKEAASYVVPAHRLTSGSYQAKSGRNDGGTHRSGGFVAGETRNRRSVWTIPSQPYSGAHFAVMPPALVEPCILASTRPGDVVLDPFFGSGTTGEVAQRLGRQWIGCELNPGFGPLQQQRTAQQAMEL